MQAKQFLSPSLSLFSYKIRMFIGVGARVGGLISSFDEKSTLNRARQLRFVGESLPITIEEVNSPREILKYCWHESISSDA